MVMNEKLSGVYIIRRADGLVKFGRTSNWANRWRFYERQKTHKIVKVVHFAVTERYVELEDWMHRLHFKNHVWGEWFRLNRRQVWRAVKLMKQFVEGKSIYAPNRNFRHLRPVHTWVKKRI